MKASCARSSACVRSPVNRNASRTPAPMWRAYSSSSPPSETSGSDASVGRSSTPNPVPSAISSVKTHDRAGRYRSDAPQRGSDAAHLRFPVPSPRSRNDRSASHRYEGLLFAMDTKLTAERRSDAGKGVARKLRAAGKIPAVLYGQGLETTPLTVDSRELTHLLHGSAGSNVLVDLMVDGEEHLAIPREIQRDHIHSKFVHVDFLAVSRTETITVNVPVARDGRRRRREGRRRGRAPPARGADRVPAAGRARRDRGRHHRRGARRHGARERPRAARGRHDPHEPRGRRALGRDPGRAPCRGRPVGARRGGRRGARGRGRGRCRGPAAEGEAPGGGRRGSCRRARVARASPLPLP